MKLKRFLLRYYPPGIVGKPRGKKTAPEKKTMKNSRRHVFVYFFLKDLVVKIAAK